MSKYYNVPFIVTADMNYFQASSLNKTLFRFHQSPNEPLEVPRITLSPKLVVTVEKKSIIKKISLHIPKKQKILPHDVSGRQPSSLLRSCVSTTWTIESL